MEVDEVWQKGRRYMRMDNLDEDESEVDEKFMADIHMVKEGSRLNEELVAQ